MLRVRLEPGFGRRPLLLLTPLLAACAGTAVPPLASPAPAPRWAPIPAAAGPLAIRVQYPSPGALIAARDSTFLLGSVGHGGATLTVNGAPVPVFPNGAFLAWVAMPAREPAFVLEATLPDGSRQRSTLAYRRPAPRTVLPPTGPVLAEATVSAPAAGLVRRADEPVRVALRVGPGATAALLLPDSSRAPLPLLALAEDGLLVREVPAGLLRAGATIRVVRGPDVQQVTVPAVGDADSLTLVRVGREAADSDAVVIARPIPGGTYKWFLTPGTILQATGRDGPALRVRLDSRLEVWVDAAETTPLLPGTPAPRRIVSNARVVPHSAWVDVVLPMGARPAWRVEQASPTALRLTLHGATANTDIIWFQRSDSLVRDVTWTNDGTDRAEYTVHLGAPVFGWMTFWRGDAFVLRVRRPPVIADPAAPLRGLRIAIDAGHPPAGSTGPTGLYEGDAVLAVAQRVERELVSRGATVLMTRTGSTAVPLGDRWPMARRAQAHAFVSIHLNAKPDGVNPRRNSGSGTYFFQAHSAPLARAIQAELVPRLGQGDDGTWYDNLAVVRGAWMPSVLVEGAYLILPEVEAALRTPEFQEAYAQSVVAGLASYFRGRR